MDATKPSERKENRNPPEWTSDCTGSDTMSNVRSHAPVTHSVFRAATPYDIRWTLRLLSMLKYSAAIGTGILVPTVLLGKSLPDPLQSEIAQRIIAYTHPMVAVEILEMGAFIFLRALVATPSQSLLSAVTILAFVLPFVQARMSEFRPWARLVSLLTSLVCLFTPLFPFALISLFELFDPAVRQTFAAKAHFAFDGRCPSCGARARDMNAYGSPTIRCACGWVMPARTIFARANGQSVLGIIERNLPAAATFALTVLVCALAAWAGIHSGRSY